MESEGGAVRTDEARVRARRGDDSGSRAPVRCAPTDGAGSLGERAAGEAEAQADWYEAEAELEGERCTLQVFSLRSMASGGAFHRAYRRATQPAFLEAQELAFGYFGGVFRQGRDDKLKRGGEKNLR